MVLAAVSNTLRYDPTRCINCGMCVAVCPHGVFAPNGKVVELAVPEACMECGACMRNCPAEAIWVESGVGCAAAMIAAALRGRPLDEGTCGDDTCCGATTPADTPTEDEPAECG
jgi:NAD-dependent dihydropyrimidine dehydrogenase PreA subunit